MNDKLDRYVDGVFARVLFLHAYPALRAERILHAYRILRAERIVHADPALHGEPEGACLLEAKDDPGRVRSDKDGDNQPQCGGIDGVPDCLLRSGNSGRAEDDERGGRRRNHELRKDDAVGAGVHDPGVSRPSAHT